MHNLISLLEKQNSNRGIHGIGRVTSCKGPIITAQLPHGAVGDACTLNMGDNSVLAEIVGFSGEEATLAPLDSVSGIGPGTEVIAHGRPLSITVPRNLLGSIIDPLGNPLNRQASTDSLQLLPLSLRSAPPPPLTRQRISERLNTGVSAIDCFCPIGKGQRLGLMASAGVGKSTLLGMIARFAEAEVIVVGLIGERGREVREFIEDCLGESGLRRSVMIVSTSDESPNRRRLAAYTATSVAEHYRAQGKQVLLLMDSITRFARAVREVGLAAGEIPVRHGYPPSLYIELPRLLERSGCSDKGSITAIYTVLTDNERELDPLAEEVKSILDGHLSLSTRLAERGIRPALDIPSSVSRLIGQIEDAHSQATLREGTRFFGRLMRDKDILLLGGTPDPELSATLKYESQLMDLISQEPLIRRDCSISRLTLSSILGKINQEIKKGPEELLPAPQSLSTAKR